MFFRAVTTPLMTPVPNFNKWCAVFNFLFKNIDFCIFTPKTLLVKETYFLTLWNFTYLKDTSFGKKSCNFEHGLETKNEFEKWPLITFFQCTYMDDMQERCFSLLKLDLNIKKEERKKKKKKKKKKITKINKKWLVNVFF